MTVSIRHANFASSAYRRANRVLSDSIVFPVEKSLLPPIPLPERHLQTQRLQLREADIREQGDERAVHPVRLRNGHVEGAIPGGAPARAGLPGLQAGQARGGRRLDDGQPDILRAHRPVHLREAAEPELAGVRTGADRGATDADPEGDKEERGSVARGDEEVAGHVLDAGSERAAVGAIDIGLPGGTAEGDNGGGGPGPEGGAAEAGS